LALFYQLWLKRALPITGNFDLDLALLSLQRFLAPPIALVACLVALACMFGVAQVRVQLCLQAPLNHGLGQLFQQTVFGQDVLWMRILFEQFINQFASDDHG
jgi:hypothetical protein